MTDSYISNSSGGTTFVGRDATELFRATVLASAIKLLQRGITPRRGLTMKRALALVKPYTGRDYKRGEVDQALADLRVWIETMKSAIPVQS